MTDTGSIRIGDRLGPASTPLTVIGPFVTAAGDTTPMWEARLSDGLRVVVREVDPSLVNDAARSRLDRLSRLRHPNVVTLKYVYLESSPAYVASHLVEGVSLQTFLDSKGLGVIDVVYITRQILLGLDAAHEAGIVHGHLRPSSVLVESRVMSQGFGVSGVVKLAGFDRLDVELVGDIKSDLRAAGQLMKQMLEPHETLDAGLTAFLGRMTGTDQRLFDSAGTAADALDQLSRGNSLAKPGILRQGQSRVVSPARTNVCPSCKADCPIGDNYCMRCGTQVVYHVRRCNSCNGYPDPSDKCCTRCGSELPPPVNFAPF